jgi:hypothetical protein
LQNYSFQLKHISIIFLRPIDYDIYPSILMLLEQDSGVICVVLTFKTSILMLLEQGSGAICVVLTFKTSILMLLEQGSGDTYVARHIYHHYLVLVT